MKIGIDCHDFEDYPRWGIGRHIENILKEISLNSEFQKHEYFLYFRNSIPSEEFLDRPFFHKKILKFIRPSFTLYYNLFLPLKAMLDGVGVMFFPANMLPIFYIRQSIVQLPIDIFYEIKKGGLAFRHKIGYTVLSTWAMWRANKIMTNSNYSKRELTNKFGLKIGEKIFANPLGIDTVKFQINNLPKENLILNVGQAFPRRRTKEIIEAFCLFISQNENNKKYKLLIIGKDKYNPPSLDKLIKDKNSLLGYTAIERKDYIEDDELVSNYKKARLLLYISSSEAQGLPPIEALACGTAPVVADNDLNKEIFGENAFFVQDEKDPFSIADAIREGTDDNLKYQSIINSRGLILAKFNWHIHVKKLLDEIENI